MTGTNWIVTRHWQRCPADCDHRWLSVARRTVLWSWAAFCAASTAVAGGQPSLPGRVDFPSGDTLSAAVDPDACSGALGSRALGPVQDACNKHEPSRRMAAERGSSQPFDSRGPSVAALPPIVKVVRRIGSHSPPRHSAGLLSQSACASAKTGARPREFQATRVADSADLTKLCRLLL